MQLQLLLDMLSYLPPSSDRCNLVECLRVGRLRLWLSEICSTVMSAVLGSALVRESGKFTISRKNFCVMRGCYPV